MAKKRYRVFGLADRIIRIAGVFLRFPYLAYLLTRYLGRPLLSDRRETKYNKYFKFVFEMGGAGMIRPEDFGATRHLFGCIGDYLRDVADADYRGKPVVWAGWNVSNEILRAFDVQIFIPETLAELGHLLGTGFPVQLIEHAETEGVPIEYCSASKVALGTYLRELAPKPDVIVTSSHPCDSMVSSYQSLQYLSGAPLYVMDTPYWRDDESYRYYEESLRGLIAYLEEKLNQKIDWDKLKAGCENANRTNYYIQEMSEMSRAAPSPVIVHLLLLGWLGRETSFGLPGLVDYTKKLYENAKARLEKGEGYYKQENIRVVWWDVPIAFTNIFSWMEKEFGAVAVADFVGRVQSPQIDTSSRDSMLRDLARTHLNVTMARQLRGPIGYYTDEFQKIIDEYSPDCFIFVRHNGCKHGWASLKMVKDVCKKAGLPALLLSTDIFDIRNCPEEEIKKQISGFFRSNGLA